MTFLDDGPKKARGQSLHRVWCELENNRNVSRRLRGIYVFISLNCKMKRIVLGLL